MLLGKSINNTKAIDKRKLVEVDSDSEESPKEEQIAAKS